MHKSLAPCAPTRDAVAGFIARFERGEVSRAEWTHAAHLLAGYWYVSSLGLEQAIAQLRRRIRFHNEAVGTVNTDSAGYHESLTRLFAHGIAAKLARCQGESFDDALVALLGSALAASDWPLQYYTRERLFSVEARLNWVEPDLKPLPCP